MVRIEGSAGDGYHLIGDLTYETVPAAYEQEIEFTEQTRLDLSDVARIDSAGLALLVEWTCVARRQNKKLVLERIPESLRSLIEVSGLREVLTAETG